MTLTHEQETTLAKRTMSGDKAARDEFITANIPLVVHIAIRYAGRGVELEDLIQEGMFGLITAVERFNYQKNIRLCTYATYWIQQTIGRAIENQSRLIRLPVHIIAQIAAVVRAIHTLARELDRNPNMEEVAERTGFNVDKIVSLLKASRSPVYIDDTVNTVNTVSAGNTGSKGSPGSKVSRGGKGSKNTGNGKRESIEYLSGDIEAENSVFDKVLSHEVSEKVNEALGKLSDRDEQVIRRRYGIGNPSGPNPYAEETMEVIGRDFHISREGIRQIEIKALKKLRPLMMPVQQEIEGISGGWAEGCRAEGNCADGNCDGNCSCGGHTDGACADGGRIDGNSAEGRRADGRRAKAVLSDGACKDRCRADGACADGGRIA